MMITSNSDVNLAFDKLPDTMAKIAPISEGWTSLESSATVGVVVRAPREDKPVARYIIQPRVASPTTLYHVTQLSAPRQPITDSCTCRTFKFHRL